jgi:hypothetical protein
VPGALGVSYHVVLATRQQPQGDGDRASKPYWKSAQQLSSLELPVPASKFQLPVWGVSDSLTAATGAGSSASSRESVMPWSSGALPRGTLSPPYEAAATLFL